MQLNSENSFSFEDRIQDYLDFALFSQIAAWWHFIKGTILLRAAIYAAAPGEQLGVWCLTQGHLSRGIEGGRERCTFTPPTYNSCWTWDSNSQPLGLTIRPRLPLPLLRRKAQCLGPWGSLAEFVKRILMNNDSQLIVFLKGGDMSWFCYVRVFCALVFSSCVFIWFTCAEIVFILCVAYLILSDDDYRLSGFLCRLTYISY